ncbi:MULTISPECIES: hypothetical protein [Streptomyces]|uniref:hypothetical protein n=1 Tax=Streptomyces TaxID=1883 RepID=UPI001684C82B|nr:hypothetical protein [Streptomyces venezuelae]
MLRAVLADASRFGVALPAPAEFLGELPARFGHRLAEVRRPALVHFDAWGGTSSSVGPRTAFAKTRTGPRTPAPGI